MADSIVIYDLDQVDTLGNHDHLAGQLREFLDVNYASTAAVRPDLTQMKIKARWVKNDSGGTLAARTAVNYKSGYWGKRVGAACGVSPERPDGVVNPYAGTIADGAWFWMIVAGPCELISDGASTIALTDLITTAASGKTKKVASGTAATIPGTFARPMETVTNADGTTYRAMCYVE